uniref:J domain-containing protein n=2 Tax=Heliothis virescens TaxID=7102 RepID=A0A2A4JD33_HELVI
MSKTILKFNSHSYHLNLFFKQLSAFQSQSKSVVPIQMPCYNNSSKFLSGVIRTLSTSTSRCRSNSANHYDILGITPKATQGDIKSAYYKLSKIYHPDISSDETSAKKFRAISEAYEVLGNVKLKKMYDKGLLGGRMPKVEYEPEPEPTDPTLKFYKSRGHRREVPTMDGRQPIYDFDSWSKHHYGSLFEKSRYEKEYLKKKREKQIDTEHSNRQEAFLYFIVCLGGLFIFLVSQGTTNYDLDRTGEKKDLNSTE